jgi:bifunctional non-homologous end joining protein LigD
MRRGARRPSHARIPLAPMVPVAIADAALVDEHFVLSPLVDGWRCLVVIDDRVRVRTRIGRDVAREIPALADALERACAGRKRGYTVLDAVLALPHGADGDAAVRGLASADRVVVIDALSIAGREVMSLDLPRRLNLLRTIGLPSQGSVTIAPVERGPAASYFEQFVAAGDRGLLARRASSPYRPGARCREWLAVSVSPLAELILCGIANGGSLVLGMPTPYGIAFAGVTWPTRRWADLALRCVPGEAPFASPRIWASLGRIAWSVPSLWVTVSPDVRAGSGQGGPRWRFVRVAEDLVARDPECGEGAGALPERAAASPIATDEWLS